MKESILKKIPHQKVTTEIESIDLYRLGIFEGAMYELVELQAGQVYPPHKHANSEAKLHMILGDGLIILNGEEQKYTKGDVFSVEKGMSHGFKVHSPTLFLSIQKPAIIDPETGKVDVEYL